MFNQTVEYFETWEQKTRLVSALNGVCATRPYLSGLASLVKIYVSNSLDTAGITPTGRLLINPQFMEQLNLQELTFVLAHEIMHLVLQTHEREGSFKNHELVNIAHDFIINDDLLDDFASCTLDYCEDDRPPANALHWPDYSYSIEGWKPAREYSLEELVRVLVEHKISPERSWVKKVVTSNSSSMSDSDDDQKGSQVNSANPRLRGGGGGGSLGSILSEAGITLSEPEKEPPKSSKADSENECHPIQNPWDVLSDEDERLAFPELSLQDATSEKKAVQEAAVRSYSEAVLMDALKKNEDASSEHGLECGNGFGMIELLRGSYTTPWEAALQRWFDAVTPGDRSFARASRRGAWRTDVVLPGRKREGWTLHIVLDTSGSMTWALRNALGAIDQFCQNNNVDTVHILQCDVDVTADEWLEVGNLENFEAKGFGGSDMSPAMLKLAEDPDVTAVIVLTDGYISYPSEEPPYETLWAIVDGGRTNFNYGIAIQIESN